jgi:hypothetical protein
MSSLTRTLILIIIACLLAALALPLVPVEADAHILANVLRISQVYGGGEIRVQPIPTISSSCSTVALALST